MSPKVLLTSLEDGIATWTFHRPDKHNAFNFSILYSLRKEIEELKNRPETRVIIITGSGEKAFSAGADLEERLTLGPAQVKEFVTLMRNIFTSIEELNRPVIAAVNGLALGAGTELALACDIRIMADTARMGLPETKLAIIPGAGGTQRLPRLVGRGKAKELIFTGRQVESAEAVRIGLANRACPARELMAECRAMAAQICEAGPLALELAKEAINRGLETDIHTGLAMESNAYWVTIPTEDRMEGLVAFREKRKPVYKGK